jgi:hypothetical protein
MMLPEAELWTEVIALSLRDLTHPKNHTPRERLKIGFPQTVKKSAASSGFVS